MDQTEEARKTDYVELTAELVSAYVSHNSVQRGDLSELIASVHASLTGLGSAQSAQPAEKATPAVPVKKSVHHDFLISLEDGRRYKSLKRHLSGRGLTPERYREKYGLPHDYPMVAPSYAKQRSDLAKSMGLGRQRRREEAPAEAPAAARGGRKAKAAG